MNIVARVRAILVEPRDEWARIKAEPGTPAGLFTSYAAVLAAVPAGFQFLGNILVGRRLPFVGLYRWPVGRALGNAVVAYVLSLAAVYLFALIIRELAPSFASARDTTAALKLAVYSMTPAWVAGVLYIVPGLWALGVLASLYGLYILYLGLDAPMMGTPKDRVGSYLAVCVLVVIGLHVVINLFLKMIFAVRYGRL
ncbi:MAG TPA: Yip1 family protein [Candidatus Aminicenantes bacterium]|nr:Yip1 family protein [Candidatus Aminicenantes bacterium]